MILKNLRKKLSITLVVHTNLRIFHFQLVTVRNGDQDLYLAAENIGCGFRMKTEAAILPRQVQRSILIDLRSSLGL
jgi:hypothetical protein